MIDVFMSYSSEDQAFARELVQRLEADGISVWIDYKDAVWGTPFPASIEAGLDQARHIICLMSRNWTSSAWSRIERYSAMVDDPDGFLGKLLPILIDPDTEVPRFMKPLVYLDCTKPGGLAREYKRIRDHIRTTGALKKQTGGTALPRLLDAGGTHLPALGYVLVVGHPGAGKSTFARVLAAHGSERGMNVERRSDYPFLQALFRLDMARGNAKRFEPDPKSEFRVKDLAVYDEALKLIHDEIISADVPPNTLRIVEFSRPHYDSAFLYYTMRALVNSAIVHINAPLSICQHRNELRRHYLERRLAGVVSPADAFDFDPDVHYVPPSVYERYSNEAEGRADQALVLALMPARAYVPVDNSGDRLDEYRTACSNIVVDILHPLIDAPEKLANFYRRRTQALQSFVSQAQADG